jgi:hypothetical protein
MVKTNLIIALTPYVINDMSDLRRVLEKKMRERREFVERFGAQERPDPQAQFDYRRKRGMLEEINRVSREIDTEADELQRIRQSQMHDESGPVELPGTGGGAGLPPLGTPGPTPAGGPTPLP